MAAGRLLLTESLQSSMTARHHPSLEHHRQLQQLQHKQQQQQQQEQHHALHQQRPRADAGVGVVGRVALVAAMFGVEAYMAFGHIYLFLMLQYLGTPVALMSTSGVLTGSVSLLIIPVLGHYTTTGEDPWKRKMHGILFGMAMFLVGTLLLASAGILKIFALGVVVEDWTNATSSQTNATGVSLSLATAVEYRRVPTTAILGLLGFTWIDAAYDVAAPSIRSFALDTVGGEQHSSVLATCTVMQALGGTLMAALGLLHLPTIMEANFGIDGMSGTLLLLCTVLAMFLLTGFMTSVVTGRILETSKRRRASFERLRLGSETSSQVNLLSDHSNSSLLMEPSKNTAKIEYIPDIMHTDERRPLLLTDDGNSSSLYANATVFDKSKSVVTTKDKITQTSTDKTNSTQASKSKLSKAKGSDMQQEQSFLKNKRLIITAISCFLGDGCLLSFSLYASNTLTIGVYRGDPTAPSGSRGRELFEMGMRTSALGTFLLYISALICSVLSHRMIHVVGEKTYYIFVCTVVAVCLAIFVWTQSEVAYFVAMVSSGGFRCAILTIPFMLATKIIAQENVKNLGRAISLLGLMMPASYLLLSSGMGPVIDATGNVWVPMIYAVIVLLLSSGSLALLYLVGPSSK